MYSPLLFQREAIDELKAKFVSIWKNNQYQLPMVLKAPTGSGKTLMVCHFINDLNHLPNWDRDKSFIWITFSDDLAMQSRDKFNEYFVNELENDLLTFNDFDRGKLKKNDILFINWQKLTSSAAENRILRRPEDEDLRKEIGYYFEDFVENTHNDGRELILIVDEAHTHTSTLLAQEIIDKINPKVILKITATPKDEDELKARRFDGFVEINRTDVVDQGLIKEKILVQTDEDLQRHHGEDLDKVLLDLGIEKRIQIVEQYKAINKNINPLMLIQLPNDDSDLIKQGEKTKESIVLDYFKEKGIEEHKVALRFSGSHKRNLDFITDNDSDVDFLLFKLAAGTGWDCPRAHILVMFREIGSRTFYVQTIGRILRMAEPHKKDDYKNSPDLRTGFLFTNYSRQDVSTEDFGKTTGNKPFIYSAKVKTDFKESVQDFKLQSDFVSRVDYGDLADSAKFQISFLKSLNGFFDIAENDEPEIRKRKLIAKNIQLDIKITDKLVVNAEFKDFDQLSLEFARKGSEEEFEISKNDVEKTFTYLCYDILRSQTDEDSKVGSIIRSWSPLKSSIRVWMSQIFGDDNNQYYQIFINDVLQNEGSKFRSAITKALKEYRPLLKEILATRKVKEEVKDAPVFRFKTIFSYTEDYKEFKQKHCILNKCFFVKDLFQRTGNIELTFAKYIDSKGDKIDWWFKNGDNGKDYFALKYFNTTENIERLFYPDWLIKFKDGHIGIFDTKDGQTLKTEGRAKGLAKKLNILGGNYVGGIIKYDNNLFYYCNSENYDDISPSNNDWKEFESIF